MSEPKIKTATNAWRWVEYLFLGAGILALAVCATGYLGGAAYQSWQNYSFECRLQGTPPTLRSYLAYEGQRLVEAEEAWCGVGAEPATAARALPLRAQRRPAAVPDGLVGRLVIPLLHLGEIVREGDGEGTLSLALGHIPGTALPGQGGNVGVAGHRDTLFRSLRLIGKNDRIQFQTLDGSYDYRVESVAIVKPTDVAVLAPGRHAELTLVTCYPFYFVGAAPDRFIVKARQVSP